MAIEQFHSMKGTNRSEPRETPGWGPIDLERQGGDAIGKFNASARHPVEPHVLIVSDDDAISQYLEVILLRAGLASERVRTMTAGCESARSGRFQVVVTTTVLPDGTWKRLTDMASRYRPGFMVILVVNTFHLKQWAEALGEGTFAVLDASHELPKVGEAVRRAFSAAHLERTGPHNEVSGHLR
jgi:DNA-binding NtrC family response regulator